MNQMSFVLLGLAALAAVPSLGNAQGTMNQFQAMREQSAQDVAAHAELMLDQEAAAAAAEIAEQRYLAGCEPVVDWSQTTYVRLVENEVVIDPTTKFPISEGVVVCDAGGGTGVMRRNAEGLPVVQSFAFTGNQEVIRHRLSQYPQFKEGLLINARESNVEEVSYDSSNQ